MAVVAAAQGEGFGGGMTLGGGFSDRGGGSCGGDTRRDGGGSVSCGGGGVALVGASVAVRREGFDVGGWRCGGDDAQVRLRQRRASAAAARRHVGAAAATTRGCGRWPSSLILRACHNYMSTSVFSLVQFEFDAGKILSNLRQFVKPISNPCQNLSNLTSICQT